MKLIIDLWLKNVDLDKFKNDEKQMTELINKIEYRIKQFDEFNIHVDKNSVYEYLGKVLNK